MFRRLYHPIHLTAAAVAFWAFFLPRAQAQVLDYCANHPDPKVGKPIDLSRPKPPVGVWQTDPDFGFQFMRLTNGGTITPMYGTVPPCNSNGTRCIVYSWSESTWILLDGSTFANLGRVFPPQGITGQNTGARPSDVEQLLWDRSDPNVLHFPSKYAQNSGPIPNLMRYNLASKVMQIERNFNGEPTNCRTGIDELEIGNDPQHFSGPLIGLQCGIESGGAREQKKFVYDYQLGVIHTVASAGVSTYGTAPYPLPRQQNFYFKGKVYSLEWEQQLSLKMSAEDTSEHANSVKGVTDDWYVHVSFDPPPGEKQGLIVSENTRTGERRMTLGVGTWPGFTDAPNASHATGLASSDPRAAGWVLVSSTGNGGNFPSMFDRMLTLAHIDSGKVCRIGRHMSNSEPYSSEPHPASRILADGTLEFFFASNWKPGDSGGAADLYVGRVRPGGSPPSPPPPSDPPPTPTPPPTQPPPTTLPSPPPTPPPPSPTPSPCTRKVDLKGCTYKLVNGKLDLLSCTVPVPCGVQP